MSKEKKRDPIKVMLRWTVILAVVAVAALLLGNAITVMPASAIRSLICACTRAGCITRLMQ